MARIHQLSDDVANQIAAGEVVERPAAVVKELVENALDAGARQIEVEFRNGGKSFLRVSDDGAGMAREDAVLALRRHATSKLREARDLLSLNSFGFRGEALPSIASVSRFSLRTREASAVVGTEILIDGRHPATVRDCGMSPGTTVEVSRLFHTVPARRKFLKTDRTEAAHIVLLCRLFAVAHPSVGFTLLEDNNIRFRATPDSTLETRVHEVFGRQLAQDLMPVAALPADPGNAGISLTGLIAKPGTGRATRAEMFTFVNRRPVESRVLHYALVESFHTYIPKGRYPACFLFVEIPPAAVDVNVHPTKREVRFRNEGQVRAVVMEALLATLRTAARARLAHAAPVEHARPLAPPAVRPEPSRTENALPSTASERRETERLAQPAPSTRPPPLASAPPPIASHSPPATTAPPPQRSLNWRFLAIAHERQALFESGEGIVVLHLAAAEERIHYEAFLKQWEDHAIPVQTLLFPLSLEFDPVRAAVLAEHPAFFRELGLEIEPFGRNFFRLRSVPQALDPAAGERFLRDLVALVAERGSRHDPTGALRPSVAQLAARQIARQRSRWDAESATRLAHQLLACEQPISDPRGRPTFYEISHRENERRLGL